MVKPHSPQSIVSYSHSCVHLAEVHWDCEDNHPQQNCSSCLASALGSNGLGCCEAALNHLWKGYPKFEFILWILSFTHLYPTLLHLQSCIDFKCDCSSSFTICFVRFCKQFLSVLVYQAEHIQCHPISFVVQENPHPIASFSTGHPCSQQSGISDVQCTSRTR